VSKTTAALRRENRNTDEDVVHSKTESTVPHTSSKINDCAESRASPNSHQPCESQILQLEARPSRKDKSLGVLTLRFIGLFLQSGCGTVSLDSAAVQLVEGDAEPNKLKTITRRLYDIANVLCALSLIERATSCGPCRKPVFKLCPPPECAHGTFPSAEASAQMARDDFAAPDPELPQKRKGGLSIDGAEEEPCPKRCKPDQRLSNINSQG
jgi:hypothetical protein